MAHEGNEDLPDSQCRDLCLAHPTTEELITIWTNTAASWKDSLALPAYLENSLYMATVPLAKDGGMSNWILVDGRLPPGKRRILSSCETFRKRTLTSDAQGIVSENIVHGIASVFCPPKYRRHGYSKRLMQDLARELFVWQKDERPCVGSVLYSDIGKSYYAKLGWHPNVSNRHIEFRPQPKPHTPLVNMVRATDLPALCARDEALLRKRLAVPTQDVKTRIAIIPNLDHIQWHLAKEDFACNHLFGAIPLAIGAIAGSPGGQVWALWTHRYYDHPDAEKKNNTLYLLRLVMEVDETATRLPSDAGKVLYSDIYDEQTSYLKDVLQAAQNEAFKWKLDTIQLWDPSPLVQDMLTRMNMKHMIVEREETSITSGLWYDEQGFITDSAPLWVNNEHYAWC